jgi:hypothetical protein
MFRRLYAQKRIQLVVGMMMGVIFGFLLQKGGVTKYDVIIGQLLLTDFTVVKIMLSAVITGMLGVHFLRSIGMARLHPKPGSLGASVIGGLIFGIGFATLGYCPGTVAGAVGQGSLDALCGGVVGTLIGTGIFASLYPRLEASVLHKGDFGELTMPQLLRASPWAVVVAFAMILTAILVVFEKAGL